MSENWAYRIVVLIVWGLLALEASVSAVSDLDVSKVNLKTKPSTSVNTTFIHGNVTSAQVRGLEDEESSSLMEDAEEDVMARQIVDPSAVQPPPTPCRSVCEQQCTPENGFFRCRKICNRRCIVGDEEQNSTASSTTATAKPGSAKVTTEKPDTETDNTEEGNEGPDSGEEGTDESDATTPKPKKKVKTVPKKPTSGLGLTEIPDRPIILPVPVGGLPMAPAVLPVPVPLAAYGRPFLDRFHPFSYDPFRFRPYRHRRRFPFRFFDESADDETPESESMLVIADEE